MEAFGPIKLGLLRVLEFLVIVIMATLVLDVVWGVFSRYVLGNQSEWTEELANILLVWVGMLGASVGFIRHVHLGVDYFVNKIPGRGRCVIDIGVLGCVIFFGAAVMVYGGGSKALSMLTADFPKILPVLQVNEGYFYTVLPLSGLIIVLTSIEDMVDKVRLLLSGDGAVGKGGV